MPLRRVVAMLEACAHGETVLPPTALYNEGWMLRLVLDWFSRSSDAEHPLRFVPGSRWYSEALLPSQFLARSRQDPLAESWTHADGAIGHFRIGARGRGDLHVNPDTRQLVIIEAKMFSGLSAGTRRAPMFNQAARNVACIAEVLHRAGLRPNLVDHLGFVVIAPAEQISGGVFGDVLEKSSLQAAVAERVASYGGHKDSWFEEWFEPTLTVVSVDLLSWEEIALFISTRDTDAGPGLREFLSTSLTFNRPVRANRST